MRILIDSKDLIDIVEYHRPITADDLSSWLIAHDSKLVFTMTNISELAAPLCDPNTDILHIRSLLQIAEKLPHVFLREGTIEREELAAAAIAFLGDRNYEAINPYVDRWDSALMPMGDSPTRIFVNYRLDEIVFELWRADPDMLVHSRRLSKLVIDGILRDRALSENVRRNVRQNYPYSLGLKLRLYGVVIPDGRIGAFAKWLYSDPRCAPGHRMSYEMYHALRGNVRDQLNSSDLPDLAHTYAIPYVDAATMDRRMTAYAGQVAKRMNKKYSGAGPNTRIFPSVEDLLSSIR